MPETQSILFAWPKTILYIAKEIYTRGVSRGWAREPGSPNPSKKRSIYRTAFRVLLKGGQNSCFRIPGGASATCCTLQYIYIVKFQGGGGGQTSSKGGGANAPLRPPPPLPPKCNPDLYRAIIWKVYFYMKLHGYFIITP